MCPRYFILQKGVYCQFELNSSNIGEITIPQSLCDSSPYTGRDIRIFSPYLFIEFLNK